MTTLPVELRRKVRHAQRRLALVRFVDSLVWCASITFSAALVALLIDRRWSLPAPAWCWPTGGLTLGLLGAAVWAFLTGRGRLDAAIEIDRRFGLQERVSSAVAIAPESRESPIGKALLADAAARLRPIDVQSRFAVQPRRGWLLPLAPAALLAGVMTLPPAKNEPPPATTVVLAAAPDEQVRQASKPLRAQLAAARAVAQRQGDNDAERFFQSLEQEAERLVAAKLDRIDAQITFQNLSDRLRERRRQTDSAEQVRQALRQGQAAQHGPGDGLAGALERGDLAGAASALQKLGQTLETDKLSAQQRRQWAEQLTGMQQRLDAAVETQRQASRAVEQQAQRLHEAGESKAAQSLEQRLDQAAAAPGDAQPAASLAAALGAAAQQLGRQGVPDRAAINAAQKQLRDLHASLAELPLLGQTESQLRQAHDQLNCRRCGGRGCNACQGGGEQAAAISSAAGDRPGAWNAPPARQPPTYQAFDAQTPQQVRRGQAMVIETAPSANRRGRVEQTIREQTAAVRHGETEPPPTVKMSRAQREQTREYFERLRDSK